MIKMRAFAPFTFLLVLANVAKAGVLPRRTTGTEDTQSTPLELSLENRATATVAHDPMYGNGGNCLRETRSWYGTLKFENLILGRGLSISLTN